MCPQVIIWLTLNIYIILSVICAFPLWFCSGLYRSQCYAYLRLVFCVILYIQYGLYKYFSGLILVFLLLFALGVRHGWVSIQLYKRGLTLACFCCCFSRIIGFTGILYSFYVLFAFKLSLFRQYSYSQCSLTDIPILLAQYAGKLCADFGKCLLVTSYKTHSVCTGLYILVGT